MTSSNWNATRSKQEPLHQPAYSFSHVPKAKRDLKGSSLQRITDRKQFLRSMAEMLLLCKEATRRRPAHLENLGSGGKPLSLEYMADRLDIDDPLFGYLVRTDANIENNGHWKKGMLQGFITVTTFTNWQRTFRWDSSIESAYDHDTEEMEKDLESGKRIWDKSNSLAMELQSTVRFGDIWEEGVVWPKIAEISLLGGLGCGKALVSVVIEELERMKADKKANYDYVVLQATDNSIPFYESLGFVRVGAVTEVDEAEQNRKIAEGIETQTNDEHEAVEAVPDNSPEKPSVLAVPNHFVSSDTSTYTVKKGGTTVLEVAKRCSADVWDIIFLNHYLYGDLTASSKLLAGTMLHVPATKLDSSEPRKPSTMSESEQPKFYIAKENDTPRVIAKMFGVDCLELVEANKLRLPGLLSKSRLKNGTRVKVSHLHIPDLAYKPYAHWSFPDDNFEEGEPSYMMALRLQRCRGTTTRDRPFASSLAVKVSGYQETDLLLPPSPITPRNPSSVRKPRLNIIDAPDPPKEPMGPFLFFSNEQRQINSEQFDGLGEETIEKRLSEKWLKLESEEKERFVQIATKAKKQYDEAKAGYERRMSELKAQSESESDSVHDTISSSAKVNLFNKVVKLKPGAVAEGSDYKYWYVLTYIPDLRWCHLAPMVEVGTFGEDKPKSKGRPKYMLVDEGLGEEVDITSRFCIPIKARFMKRTLDADKEEWDVIDDGTLPVDRTQKRRTSIGDTSQDSVNTPRKPLTNPASKPLMQERPLPAVLPDSKQIVNVRIRGVDTAGQIFLLPKRGRPKGSKNMKKEGCEHAANSSQKNAPSSSRSSKSGKSTKKSIPSVYMRTPQSPRRETTPTTLSSGSSLSSIEETMPMPQKQRTRANPIGKQPKKRKYPSRPPMNKSIPRTPPSKRTRQSEYEDWSDSMDEDETNGIGREVDHRGSLQSRRLRRSNADILRSSPRFVNSQGKASTPKDVSTPKKSLSSTSRSLRNRL